METKAINFFTEMLFPSTCYSCRASGSYLCEDCFLGLNVMYEPACPHCEVRVPFGKLMDECRRNTKLDRFFASGLYSDETLASLIKDLKYKGAYVLAEALARFANWHLEQGAYAEIIKAKIDIIVPVPLHKKNLKKRGFNHAEKLAEHLSLLLEIPLEPNALAKIKKTDSQVEMASKDKRAKNLNAAFAVTDANAVKNKTILLVDDVATTGSTLRECALALRAAKAEEVWGLAIARE